MWSAIWIIIVIAFCDFALHLRGDTTLMVVLGSCTGVITVEIFLWLTRRLRGA